MKTVAIMYSVFDRALLAVSRHCPIAIENSYRDTREEEWYWVQIKVQQ
jgi:hypothetical protein